VAALVQEGPSDDPYSNPGVNIRALARLFDVVRERQADYSYRISVSVLEIYNEAIHDLLVDAKVDKDRKCVSSVIAPPSFIC
jgi:hypothetical protein